MKIQQPSLPYGPARPTVHCPFYRSTVARDTAVDISDEHEKAPQVPIRGVPFALARILANAPIRPPPCACLCLPHA